MATSEQLRRNKNQHKPKNEKSKNDDKEIFFAMNKVVTYLVNRFENISNDNSKEYFIKYSKSISIGFMNKMIKNKNIRNEYFTDFDDRSIKPDGGILLLKSNYDSEYCKVLLISEVKRQGTNDKLLMEGKPKQAKGNAIERLGKNLIGIRTMMMHENITPFVCFGWGCDFNHEDTFIDSKIFMMNEFYPLNKTFVFKKDGVPGYNFFSPVSMYFREEKWLEDEMFEILKEVAETSFRYYTQ